MVIPEKTQEEDSILVPGGKMCVSKGMILVRWQVHLPIHRKVINFLTFDAASWF